MVGPMDCLTMIFFLRWQHQSPQYCFRALCNSKCSSTPRGLRGRAAQRRASPTAGTLKALLLLLRHPTNTACACNQIELSRNQMDVPAGARWGGVVRARPLPRGRNQTGMLEGRSAGRVRQHWAHGHHGARPSRTRKNMHAKSAQVLPQGTERPHGPVHFAWV
jgi:hypothetical protein